MNEPTASKPRLAWLGWLAAVFVIAVLVLGYQTKQDVSEASGGVAQDVRAAGYGAIIDDIFSARGEGWLRLDNSGDPDAQLVTVSSTALSSYPQVLEFYRNSFLRQDIASRDPELWRIDQGRVVGIAPNAHALPLPFAAKGDWTGEIDYRDDATLETQLEVANRRFTLSPRTSLSDGADASQPSVDIFSQNTLTTGPTPADVVHLTADNHPVATAFRVGGSVPVLRLESPAVRVLVNGVELGVSEGESAYARLDPGAQVVIERQSDGRPAELNVVSAESTISRLGPFGTRIRDPNAESLALALEQAMNIAVADGARRPPAKLSLTLDAETQAALQSALEAYCEMGRSRVPGHPAFRATITVMDLATGEVLALASYPRTMDETGAPNSSDSTYLRLVRHNHNFERLSIGSAAKPIFSSAILQQFPGLDKLVLTGGYPAHDVSDLFGVALDPALNEDAMPAHIDFKMFLAQSSNRYAATLMLLAASRDPFGVGQIPTGETYDLDGPHARLPTLVFDNVGAAGQPVRLVAHDSNFVALVSDPQFQPGAGRVAAWPMWLSELYDLPLVEHVASDEQADIGPVAGGEDYDFKVWAPLVERLGDNSLAGFRDSSVSPERERLGMNVINDFRTDYINLIIGGGRSQWTTIKLAEIYGRIVTGRQINARLVRSMDESAIPPETPGSLPWNSEARSALLAGMADVSVSGTASSPRMKAATTRLQAEATARRETLEVYSKTGTPTLASRVPPPVGLAIEDLSAAGVLRVDDAGDHAGVAAGPGRMVWPLDSTSRDQAAEALARSPAVAATLEQYRVSSTDVANYLLAFNRATSSREKAVWLDVEAGRLVAAATVPTKADGRAYVLVLLRKANKSDEPPAGIVVAINIQQNWAVHGGRLGEAALRDHVAAALGTELMEGPLDRPLWLTDPNQPSAAAPKATAR